MDLEAPVIDVPVMPTPWYKSRPFVTATIVVGVVIGIGLTAWLAADEDPVEDDNPET